MSVTFDSVYMVGAFLVVLWVGLAQAYGQLWLGYLAQNDDRSSGEARMTRLMPLTQHA